jgi:hypothetical protein
MAAFGLALLAGGSGESAMATRSSADAEAIMVFARGQSKPH